MDSATTRAPATAVLTESERARFRPEYLAEHDDLQALELLRVAIRSSRDLIVVVDKNGHLAYANDAASEMLGFTSVNDVDLDVFAVIHPDDQPLAATNFLESLATTDRRDPATYRIRSASGEWRYLEVVATNCVAHPAIGGLVLSLRDVTRSEELRRALLTFGQANHVLVHATSEQGLLEETCRTIVEEGSYVGAWVGEALVDEDRSVRPIAMAGALEHLQRARITWADDGGEGPIARAIRTGELVAVEDLAAAVPERSRSVLESAGLGACCVLPLELDERRRGVLVVADRRIRRFDDQELELFGELAASLAYGLRRLRDAQALAEREERFRTLADASPSGVMETDAGGSVTYANGRMAQIAGVTPSALEGRGWVAAIHPEDRDRFFAALRAWRRGGPFASNVRLLRPDGDARHVRVAAAPASSGQGAGFVVTVADVTEEVRAQEELARLALVDPLTGLPNRTSFLLKLRTRLADRRRAGAAAVLFLDLDHFKLVNDSLGHDAGDALIQEVASRFSSVLRDDVVAARFGGDEFMFLVSGIRYANDATNLAHRLLRALDDPIEFNAARLTITASVGVALARHGDLAEDLVRDADTAMYQAKSGGRNRVVVFDEELRRRTVARLTVEADLRDALHRGELTLHYQPIVEAGSGRPVGAEALLRWQHPTRGLLLPAEFIQVAEDSGLILEIGPWVLDQAVAQAAAWDASSGPDLAIMAVNFSARQLEGRDAERLVAKVLERHSIAARRLEIEVTESAAMANLSATTSCLESLCRLGVSIAVDDFGTGYSSLSYLHALPITTVKVDRSFVERLAEPRGSTPVVRAIVEMGHAMGLRVVAEGVSSGALAEDVADLGCDLAQGFHFGMPMPADEFVAWWRAQAAAPVPQGAPLAEARASV